MAQRSLLPEEEPVRRVDASDARKQPPGTVLTTDNRELIREWAATRAAQPATGEATQSGPATVDVRRRVARSQPSAHFDQNCDLPARRASPCR